MSVILCLSCHTDIRGNPLTEDGLIGLTRISFNRKVSWQALEPLASILIRDGESLVLRRRGHDIIIERP